MRLFKRRPPKDGIHRLVIDNQIVLEIKVTDIGVEFILPEYTYPASRKEAKVILKNAEAFFNHVSVHMGD